jgi:hypothetical protein
MEFSMNTRQKARVQTTTRLFTDGVTWRIAGRKDFGPAGYFRIRLTSNYDRHYGVLDTDAFLAPIWLY